MSISNTTNDTAVAMADSQAPAPSPSVARSAIFHFFDFIYFAIACIFTIAIWAASLIVTAGLGGGALLLARYLCGYQDECPEDKKWYNGYPPSAFWAGFWPTGVFQVAFLIYFASVTEDFTGFEMLGHSILLVMGVLAFMVVLVVVVVVFAGIVQILTAVCRKGGRKSVDQEAETGSAAEKV